MPEPRFNDYPDEGCEASPSCLRCELPRCKYETEAVHPAVARAQERRATILDMVAAGESAEAIASRLGIARRTVFRLKALAA